MRDKNTLRNYRNTVTIGFKERGENFTLKVPHHNKWVAIIGFLRRRGFKVTENSSYKEHYGCLSKYHKIGHKKNVSCLLEIGPRSISVEFGNIQNLWTGIAQSFWSNPSDDRFTQLSYMEGLEVKLEIKKLMDFCSKYNHELTVEHSDLSAEEYIIDQCNRNLHIHGRITCLDDIRKSITEDTYDYKANSTDMNGKKIICGDIKCFYHYDRRIHIGQVWHNINNMWWVLINGEKRNITARALFDQYEGMPRRKDLSQDKKLQIIKRRLKAYEKNQDYEKCIPLRNYLNA